MDTTQILLVIMLLVLGSTLTIIGVQIFFILKEMQKSMQKVNTLLDDAAKVSASLSSVTDDLRKAVNSPWGTLVGVIGMVKSALGTKHKGVSDE